MAQRMEMDIGRHTGRTPNAAKGVTHPVGVRWEDAGKIGGEDEVGDLDDESLPIPRRCPSTGEDPRAMTPSPGRLPRCVCLHGHFGALICAPPPAATTLSSTVTVAPSKSMSLQRSAHASPRRIPVEATTATNPCTRAPNSREAARSERTSSSVGARTASGCSWSTQSGISVPDTGLGKTLPLHFRASRQDRCRIARVWRTLDSESPSAFRRRR